MPGCVNLHSDGTAFTYIDYERDSEAYESLTWSQVYRRTLNVAAEVRRHAAIGDRAVIPHKDSIILLCFLGALQAGLIAVPPLSPRPAGASDERKLTRVVRDAKSMSF